MKIKSFASNGPFRSRRGLILGVLRGLGEHFGISTFLLRAITIAIGVIFAFWPVILVYIASAIIMPRESKYEFS
ncbi:MAG: PspC domain-containing protein [Deltaproteobacteria bacterium]|nr:PspC domain-containing protein [Deltaproteobacteria bacterium]